ncbi:MAG: hypothetical protein ACK40X_08805, partial [Armatimonadota bacterium]
IIEAYRWQNSSWQQLCRETEAILNGRAVTVDVDGKKGIARCFRCGRIMVHGEDGSIQCGCGD